MKTITTTLMRQMKCKDGLMLGLLLMLPLTAPAKTYFVHPDHLGTPQVITDSNQSVVWQAEYEPFGQATITTGTITNNLRFPGQYFDAETNLHYNYFRDYDPTIGRYIESDLIGLRGGLNTYNYALQNSIRYSDPEGLLYYQTGHILGCLWKYLKDIAHCIKESQKVCAPPEIVEACFKRARNNYRACLRDWERPHPNPWPSRWPPDDEPPSPGGWKPDPPPPDDPLPPGHEDLPEDNWKQAA